MRLLLLSKTWSTNGYQWVRCPRHPGLVCELSSFKKCCNREVKPCNEYKARLARFAAISIIMCAYMHSVISHSTYWHDYQYTLLHAEKTLRANIANLKLAISDQNLELIPDYEQRIEVLKELKFIDNNSTVHLKGRVACEVCCSLFPFSLSLVLQHLRSTR